MEAYCDQGRYGKAEPIQRARHDVSRFNRARGVGIIVILAEVLVLFIELKLCSMCSRCWRVCAVQLCTLEAVEGELCLLEVMRRVLEMPEVMR